MGGEGSMMAANQSLKTNRNLLAKRKERKALSGSYEGIKIADFPKASERNLRLLRARLKEERRRLKRKRLVVLGLAIVLFLVVTMIIIK